MKIKIEEISYIETKWIDERIEQLISQSDHNQMVGEYDIEGVIISELNFLKEQLHPLKPLAEKCWEYGCDANLLDALLYETKEDFLTNEIEL